jgi:hypothetical protein
MPLRLQHHAVIVHNQAIYVLGGDNGFWENSTVSDRIFRAVPNARGAIAAWDEIGKLPAPLTIHAVTTLGNQLYIFGGSQTFRPGTQLLDTVFTAAISPAGAIEDFQKLAPLPTPIGWLTATAVGDRIVAISGKTRFSPTQLTEKIWATQATSKSLSAFREIGTTLPRERHATVLSDRTLVVIGGGGAKSVLATVAAASLDQNGRLTAWTELPSLPEARYAHAATTHNGYIYVSGGFRRYGSNETSPAIWRLPIRPNED